MKPLHAVGPPVRHKHEKSGHVAITHIVWGEDNGPVLVKRPENGTAHYLPNQAEIALRSSVV